MTEGPADHGGRCRHRSASYVVPGGKSTHARQSPAQSRGVKSAHSESKAFPFDGPRSRNTDLHGACCDAVPVRVQNERSAQTSQIEPTRKPNASGRRNPASIHKHFLTSGDQSCSRASKIANRRKGCKQQRIMGSQQRPLRRSHPTRIPGFNQRMARLTLRDDSRTPAPGGLEAREPPSGIESIC